MDKKKAPRKGATELSVGAGAEASPAAGEETAHKPPLTPRKRGRPRKTVKAGSEEAMEVKKAKGDEEVEEKEAKEEEACHEEADLPKMKPSGNSARRKSKPRRSC